MTVVLILVALAAAIALTALTSRRRGRREIDGEVFCPQFATDPSGPEAVAGTLSAALAHPRDQDSQMQSTFARMRSLRPGDGLREQLRESLVLEHMRYAQHIADLYISTAEPAEVAYAAARRGLTRAVDAYDPEAGIDFLTFAAPLILREVRARRRGGRIDPHPPRRSRQLADALPASADRLTRRLGRSPTISELAAELGVGTEEVVESLDTALGYCTERTDFTQASPDRAEPPISSAALSSKQIKILLAPLSERNKRIVMMRYLRGMTDAQIGAELNISPVHVCRLLTQAMAALHAAEQVAASAPASPPNPSSSPKPHSRDAQKGAANSPQPTVERTSAPEALFRPGLITA